ncbi:uncharacterized protein FIBRA_00620 [Fibroporia radiculosa]|uniref:Macrofage activating glycoprotein n=1 Tax=Fibroporia radiculosa TaxID=599839 RepID=J4G0H9_9APHY|nr:uncharacterized protein FIBRA_00620 [Fibroporia radiculosa]CCL98618.1 predicted protein [Fibroporia radiculosa]
MSPVALSALLAAAAASGILAQTTYPSVAPLVDHTYSAYSDLPYKVIPTAGDIRGPQTGYSICNSTTANQESECQVSIVNTIDDFCLWSSPTPNNTIGDSEAYEVAWCTKDGHGTRVIPPGTLQGVQYLYTSQYIMIVGFLDQTKLNLLSNDSGGELDPHGADLYGNPIGGLVWSNQYPTGNTNNASLTQITEWTEFIGSGTFCIKICNPSVTSPDNVGLCQNVYDEIGINYNCPSQPTNGTFEVCDADPMSPVGQYVSNGVTTTWTQPWSGVIDPPYTPTVPASSNCRTYASSALYTDNAQAAPTTTSSGTSSTPAPTSGGSTGATRSSGTGSPSPTSGSSASGAPSATHISLIAIIAGVAFTVLCMA